MLFREAGIEDIKQIQHIRHAVKENKLSNPSLVTNKDCVDYLTKRGKGWVCEIKNQIVGFAIADLRENNIWALFLQPEFENQGIGRQLHDIMLDWYFNQIQDKVWLSTEPNTRADIFYRKSGWKVAGTHGDGEIKFEMTYKDWIQIRKDRSYSLN